MSARRAKKTARRTAKKRASARKTRTRAKKPRRKRRIRNLEISGARLMRIEETIPSSDPTAVDEAIVKAGERIEPWARVSSEALSDHRIFRLRKDRAVHPRTKAEHGFVVMEGVDWVNVIPITDEGNVVFIEQYRHGIRATTLEIPGGMVDAGERPSHAAARELMEETGYEGGTPVELGWIHPNPAIQENRCWTYVIRGAKKVAEAHNEGSEDIATLEIPLAHVPRLIAAGRITHALVTVGFLWLWLREGFAR